MDELRYTYTRLKFHIFIPLQTVQHALVDCQDYEKATAVICCRSLQTSKVRIIKSFYSLITH